MFLYTFIILRIDGTKNKMKVIAMYLPQFHRVKENDEWWGEGFTEWTTVKGAKSIFEGHKQPIIPYRNNYYNLLEYSTMQWQADLMKKYGIDGICMYHYWFQDGRRILEKPAENLLTWKKIDMPFCFCWANETWARTWSVFQNTNVWFDAFVERMEEKRHVLLEQKYGKEKQWEEHFQYLLDFFKDERYIKIDGKPVFMIYKPELMPCVERMLDYWNDQAIKEGFPGIYFICGDSGSYSGIHDSTFDKILLWEPTNGIKKLKSEGFYKRKNDVLTMKYDDIWNAILKHETSSSRVMFAGFVNYDDTPRRGKSGKVLEGASPEKFCEYLTELFAKNKAYDNEYTFINAWNEWGEGMYLEPDEIHEYQYLEGINKAKSNYIGYVNKYLEQRNLKGFKTLSDEGKGLHYYAITDKWLTLKECNVNLEDFFISSGYRHIALYGCSSLALHLIAELEKCEVKIDYIIDKNPSNVFVDIPVYYLEQDLPIVDIIVITATFYCGDIYRDLRKKGYKNIISLEEIIFEFI